MMEVCMMDLASNPKSFFTATRAEGLATHTAKNGRIAFTAPAPTERANKCFKWASCEQVEQFNAEAEEQQA
jgi:hypothetical protein